ncbi:hypothetical protein VDGE_30067 [Verticillium dahliae]|uniref:Uncharacterized protein n=1 Tax=Verticillium dahliae TaxID=27337 RepID=A0A444RRP6_VERDA|nr:hypothetical protein VDGE_30067 [Verticillium dahliae]
MDDKFTLIKSDTLGPVKQDTTIEWKSGTGGIWIGPPGNVNRHPQPCKKDGSAVIEEGYLVAINDMYCFFSPALT